MAAALPLALLTAAGGTETIKVYHLNPISAGVVPVNMDTGDALGDLYFYLGQFLLPVECADPHASGSSGFDCNNPERRDPSLVVTEVDLEVDTGYTVYSACNLCNGTDPLSGKPCELGTYVCDCFSDSNTTAPCDRSKVGKMHVADTFGHQPNAQCKAGREQLCPYTPQPMGSPEKEDYECEKCVFGPNRQKLQSEFGCVSSDLWHYCPSPTRCHPQNPDWTCWHDNIVRKTGGLWFSTLKEGQCGGTTVEDNCTWAVKATKTVNETCMHESIVDALVEHTPACFQGCPQPKNESSSCFIDCFFTSLLGEGAGDNTTGKLGGIPLSKLEEGWTRAFNGRCPLL